MVSLIYRSSRTSSDEELIAACLAHDIDLHLPSYALIEADAVFHNASIEQVIASYLIAKLREVSSVQ